MELGELEIDHRWFHSSLPAHNKYLLIAAELGLVGLGLFLWFQWRLLRAVLRGLQTRDALLWWVGVALIGAFAATLNEFMLELFYDDKTVLMPMFINALMICFSRIATTNTGGSAA
jgi:O-antigen ligase